MLRVIKEGFKEPNSPDMKYYAFDWDDNIVHMPTKIILKTDDGEEFGMSTEDFAEYRSEIGKGPFEYKGKTIVGSKESIKKLKDSLENNDKKEALIQMLLESKYKGRNRQYFEEKDIKTLSKYVENMKKQSEPTEQKGNEPDEQKSNVDMEDLLAEVIEGDKEGDELKKTRNHVFKCLGLLS